MNIGYLLSGQLRHGYGASVLSSGEHAKKRTFPHHNGDDRVHVRETKHVTRKGCNLQGNVTDPHAALTVCASVKCRSLYECVLSVI